MMVDGYRFEAFHLITSVINHHTADDISLIVWHTSSVTQVIASAPTKADLNHRLSFQLNHIASHLGSDVCFMSSE